MTNFREMNRLVNELFDQHSPGPVKGLFGEACMAFRAERSALLVAHGWEPAHFAAHVLEQVCDDDYEVCES